MTQSPAASSWRAPSQCSTTVPDSTSAVSRLPGSCIGGSPGPPVTAPGGERVARELGALAGQRRGEDLVAVPVGAGRARSAARRSRTTVTAPSSSRRSSCESRSSRPAAIRVATCSVGLVSPRSTCESIGALTPERSARSRSDRSIASRSARIAGPERLGCDCGSRPSRHTTRTLSRTAVCRPTVRRYAYSAARAPRLS